MHRLPLTSIVSLIDKPVVMKTAQMQQDHMLQIVSPIQKMPNLHEASGGGLASLLSVAMAVANGSVNYGTLQLHSTWPCHAA